MPQDEPSRSWDRDAVESRHSGVGASEGGGWVELRRFISVAYIG